MITLPVTRRAHEVGRAGPVPVAPGVVERGTSRASAYSAVARPCSHSPVQQHLVVLTLRLQRIRF